MQRLMLNEIGPIKHIDICLNRLNVFCGPQGSGKSTIAKIVSFCSWLEKINDATGRVIEKGLINRLKDYHRLSAYFRDESSLLYIGDNVVFAYNWPSENEPVNIPFNEYDSYSLHNNEVVFVNKQKTINPKVIYIPAERNFVSSVANLRKYIEDDDALQSFVNDWFEAKRHYSKAEPLKIANINASYYYNEKSDEDRVVLDNGKILPLTDASSGYQSIIPLSMMLDWMASRLYETNKPLSPEESQKITSILHNLSNSTQTKQEEELIERIKGFVSGRVYTHTQFIIEEPEQNLFPLTQRNLMYEILSVTNHGRNHHAVLTTHSPYILYALNNTLMAYIVKDKMPGDRAKGVSCMSYAVDPKEVSVWEIDNGMLNAIQDENKRLIRKNYFNKIMQGIMSEFNEMLDFYD